MLHRDHDVSHTPEQSQRIRDLHYLRSINRPLDLLRRLYEKIPTPGPISEAAYEHAPATPGQEFKNIPCGKPDREGALAPSTSD